MKALKLPLWQLFAACLFIRHAVCMLGNDLYTVTTTQTRQPEYTFRENHYTVTSSYCKDGNEPVLSVTMSSFTNSVEIDITNSDEDETPDKMSAGSMIMSLWRNFMHFPDVTLNLVVFRQVIDAETLRVIETARSAEPYPGYVWYPTQSYRFNTLLESPHGQIAYQLAGLTGKRVAWIQIMVSAPSGHGRDLRVGLQS